MFATRAVTYGFLLLVVLMLTLPVAAAPLKVSITQGQHNPVPIALADFTGHPSAENIRNVIEKDLQNSGLFRSIPRKAFLEKLPNMEVIPQFGNWRQIDAELLLTGQVGQQPSGAIRLTIRLWDVLSGKSYFTQFFTTSLDGWRRAAHLAADEIYKQITGEGGYFDSRIVYIAESGHWKKKTKRLAIMDQDGANHRYLTSGRQMVLTPRFDPTTQRIIYLAYYGNKPQVYLYNLSSGHEELLGTFNGMSFAPRFSPDGKKAIMSVSLEGNSEIFELDLATRQKKRLTNDYAIDTSPSYAPDGKSIVFNSDRGGKQQLYIMDNNGGNVRRLTYGSGHYGTPAWSPRGDLIVFTRMHKGKFYIGVIKPDGSGERLLTESYLDEGPTWSPNGRVIIFSRKEPNYGGKPGKTQLYSIDLTGYNERKVPTPGEGSDPAWSPLLSR